ncbi:hypothetical protein [Natrarchaeobius oligotrophus]|uniref:hypothetical protein n=1 Tax=Natrarchaeobius oligotrophus TaxID=3455743 RepID=UPI001FB50B23|nr:hypothetical protein [Natrarchaeobius chitinivorans]
MTVTVAGVVSTPHGKHPDASTRELFTDAAHQTLEDAGVPVLDVEELYARRGRLACHVRADDVIDGPSRRLVRPRTTASAVPVP